MTCSVGVLGVDLWEKQYIFTLNTETASDHSRFPSGKGQKAVWQPVNTHVPTFYSVCLLQKSSLYKGHYREEAFISSVATAMHREKVKGAMQLSDKIKQRNCEGCPSAMWWHHLTAWPCLPSIYFYQEWKLSKPIDPVCILVSPAETEYETGTII